MNVPPATTPSSSSTDWWGWGGAAAVAGALLLLPLPRRLVVGLVLEEMGKPGRGRPMKSTTLPYRLSPGEGRRARAGVEAGGDEMGSGRPKDLPTLLYRLLPRGLGLGDETGNPGMSGTGFTYNRMHMYAYRYIHCICICIVCIYKR